MGKLDYIVHDGYPLVAHSCMEDAIGFMRCAIRRFTVLANGPSREDLEAVLNAAIVSEKYEEPKHLIPLDYESSDYRISVYKATLTYLDGMLCLWDGAGEGLYRFNNECCAIRNALSGLHDKVERLYKIETGEIVEDDNGP